MSVAEKLAALKAKKMAENLEKSSAFLEENAKKEGVICLQSGLQYSIIEPGNGANPTYNDTVICHYTGYNLEGVVFDSSHKRGKPAQFSLQKVIKGWQEGIPLMSVGSCFKLFVPPHLAYGEQHISAEIGPNSLLIFEVSLIAIVE
ncbi:MAG: FKBP-type peptidyl-prolyl cis-trans isomerase [Chitinophagaceae bacterium]